MRSNCSELNVLSKHPGSLQRTVFSRCRFSTQTLSTSSQMVRNSFSFMRKELSISGGATLSRFIRLVEKEGVRYQSLPSVVIKELSWGKLLSKFSLALTSQEHTLKILIKVHLCGQCVFQHVCSESNFKYHTQNFCSSIETLPVFTSNCRYYIEIENVYIKVSTHCYLLR